METESKYAVSSRPVNLRTAIKAPLQVNPVVKERLEAANARRRLGPTLMGQLSRSTERQATDGFIIFGAIAATVASIALFLAWLQSNALMALFGLVFLGASVAIFLWRKKRNNDLLSAVESAQTVVALDPVMVAQLDEALNHLLTEVSDELAGRIVALKTLLIRVCQQMGSATDEHFTLEDRFYIHECVRRYLPDSIQAYLRVPKNQRALNLSNEGQTAQSLLQAQFALIEIELQKKEVKLARSAAELLLRQQRFLESKTTSS